MKIKLDRFDAVIIVGILVAFLTGCFMTYYAFPRIVKEEVVKYSEPVTVYVEKVVPEIKTVIEYVELPPEIQYVTKTEYVEKPVKVVVEVKKELIDFPDKETLVAWADNNSRLSFQTVDINGNVDLNDANCVSFSRGMQYSAEKDGYRISQQVVIDGKLNGRKVTDIMGGHVMCLADVNGDYYAIEPQTGQVTYVGSDDNVLKRRAIENAVSE